ncbi:hypothetical protein A2W24_06820 [Microgenomates group bacterium RBG_16_45_19]|nr:MAG: hypothetical protein A2W24_06820 [Microgenomates group bacterium RBG_16_45_19]
MQKVVKVGNSLAVTLDSKQAALMNIKVGQELAMVYKADKGVISLSQTKAGLSGEVVRKSEKAAVLAGKITPELKQWTDRFLLENDEAMKKLADL